MTVRAGHPFWGMQPHHGVWYGSVMTTTRTAPAGPPPTTDHAAGFRKGSRIHLGYTRTSGVVLDRPGTVGVLVQWDGGGYGLQAVASLRHAETTCTDCGGLRQHKRECPVWLRSAHAGHPYSSCGVGERPNCKHCGRTSDHKIHVTDGGTPR